MSVTITPEYITVTTFPCSPENRMKIEKVLSNMGYSIDGGGTIFEKGNPIYSEIVIINNGKYFCLCCGLPISLKQFCWSTLCGHCDCGRCEVLPERKHGLMNKTNPDLEFNYLSDEGYHNGLPKGIKIKDEDFRKIWNTQVKNKIELSHPDSCRDCPFVTIDAMFSKAICSQGFDLSEAIRHIDTRSFVIVRPKECKNL